MFSPKELFGIKESEMENVLTIFFVSEKVIIIVMISLNVYQSRKKQHMKKHLKTHAKFQENEQQAQKSKSSVVFSEKKRDQKGKIFFKFGFYNFFILPELIYSSF